MAAAASSGNLLSTPPWFVFLVLVGAYAAIKPLLALLATIYVYLLRRPGKDLRRSYGQWAVVTGPTSGIGRSLALELARNGLDLVLVGRDPEKLRDVTREIRELAPPAEVLTVEFDFSGDDISSGVQRVKEAISGLDVGILVNNAGVAKPCAVYFHEADVEAWVRMVKVNLWSATALTAAVLPAMAAKGRGAVLNMGSGSGSALTVPALPLYSVYASTKRYLGHLSRSLHLEYKSKGIHIQCQAPLYVSTKMITWAVKPAPARGAGDVAALITGLFLTSSEDFAKASLRWIGHGALCMPNLSHRIQWIVARLVPDAVHDAVELRDSLRHREMIQRLRSQGGTDDADAYVLDS